MFYDLLPIYIISNLNWFNWFWAGFFSFFFLEVIPRTLPSYYVISLNLVGQIKKMKRGFWPPGHGGYSYKKQKKDFLLQLLFQ